MTAAVNADEMDADIEALLDDAGIHTHRALIARIMRSGLQLGQAGTSRLDLKIASAALAEMGDAFRLFAPYAQTPKVTVFGSARTQQDDPLYTQATEVAASLAAQGWMVVTGAGPGIMQAAADGAGNQMAIGVSIRLPFEELPAQDYPEDTHLVQMKYFFTRKLMLIKESRGFICLPGGFGTMDEVFELLTLQQTGKAEPMPIVLLDEPGGRFWAGLRDFVQERMAPAGVISADDFDRVLVTDSVPDAIAEVTGFWRNYDSLRWVDDQLVLRLRAEPTDAEIIALNAEFADSLLQSPIERTPPLRAEVVDGDQLDLPRLMLRPRPRQIGSLFRLISALNALESAR